LRRVMLEIILRRSTALAVAAAWLIAAAPAAAEPAAGVYRPAGEPESVVTFDTAAPGTFTSIRPVTGLVGGNLERLVGLDFRFAHITAPNVYEPASGRLFALGVVDGGATDTAHLYTIDPGTGVATVRSATLTFTPSGDSAYGVDFNPTVDRLRVVNAGDENARLNPNTGARADAPVNDSDLNPAGAMVAAAAYDRNDLDFGTPTTLYALAAANGTTRTIGGPDGSPSANGGQLMTVGPWGVTGTSGVNMDISPGGTAYATLVDMGTDLAGLYTVNLETGSMTLVGGLPEALLGLAVLPPLTTQFSAAAIRAPESGSATVRVTRSTPAYGTASVNYATADGTASGSDYGAASGTLTFAPGETEKTFDVPIAPDATDEPDETVVLTLSSPSAGLALGSPATATLTIADDDPDTSAPGIALRRVARSVTLAAFIRRGVRVTATPGEPARLEFVLEGNVRNAKLGAAFNLTLASRRFALSARSRTATLKPRRRLVGRPRKAFRVRVRVTATDAAGNRRTVTRRVTVKPRKRRR